MEHHFHKELEKLKQKLFRMGTIAEDMIRKSIEALLNRNEKMAKQVFESEKEINRLEIEIDDFGHALLALGQPMANDLRLATMSLKINTDLERIGDHAVNIAERAIVLMADPPLEKNVPIAEMGKVTMSMLSDALEAFINGDVDLARSVLKRDDEVDAYKNDINQLLSNYMEKDPQVVKRGISLIVVAHNLERVADLANNIAEDVFYLKQGKEIRHHTEEMF